MNSSLHYLLISEEMIELFRNCTLQKNYNTFLDKYHTSISKLANQFEYVRHENIRLPVVSPCLKSFICILKRHDLNSQDVPCKCGVMAIDEEISKNMKHAIEEANWDAFYFKYRSLADEIITNARQQNRIDIYIEFKNLYYPNFESRDARIGGQTKSSIIRPLSFKTSGKMLKMTPIEHHDLIKSCPNAQPKTCVEGSRCSQSSDDVHQDCFDNQTKPAITHHIDKNENGHHFLRELAETSVDTRKHTVNHQMGAFERCKSRRISEPDLPNQKQRSSAVTPNIENDNFSNKKARFGEYSLVCENHWKTLHSEHTSQETIENIQYPDITDLNTSDDVSRNNCQKQRLQNDENGFIGQMNSLEYTKATGNQTPPSQTSDSDAHELVHTDRTYCTKFDLLGSEPLEKLDSQPVENDADDKNESYPNSINQDSGDVEDGGKTNPISECSTICDSENDSPNNHNLVQSSYVGIEENQSESLKSEDYESQWIEQSIQDELKKETDEMFKEMLLGKSEVQFSNEETINLDNGILHCMENTENRAKEIVSMNDKALEELKKKKEKCSGKLSEETPLAEESDTDSSFQEKFREQEAELLKRLEEVKNERRRKRQEIEESLRESKETFRRNFLMYINLIGLRSRFEEQEEHWKNWIHCRRGHIFSVKNYFMMFKEDYKNVYCKPKHQNSDEIKEFQDDKMRFRKLAINEHNSLKEDFEKLQTLENCFQEAMFLKILKSCFAKLAGCLIEVIRLIDALEVDQESFIRLQDKMNDLDPQLIHSTTALRRICISGDNFDDYENVEFPNIVPDS